MPEDFSLSGRWLNDRIVKFSQEPDRRQRAQEAAFRLDGTSPYLRLNFVSVYVRDQERSLRFFVDKLGFSVVTDAQFASGMRWIEVSPPDGTASLALVLPTKQFNEEHLVGNSGVITFLTEDVDRTYREWADRGVEFTIPPQTPAWGGTFCRFIDPDGNSFVLAGFTDATRAIDERRRAYAEKLEDDRRTAQELEIAREVQARLFPQVLPEVPGLEYAGVCLQARSVGGDYYDFLALGDGNLGFIVGDVAGKGIAAALLMVNLQANLRSQFIGAANDPQRFLASVNRLFFENTAGSAYATLLYAGYESATGRIIYANCGHVPGLILRANGIVERLDSNATVLGLFEDWQCSPSSTELRQGDLLALYSDGVTESEDNRGDQFGEERLLDAIRSRPALPVHDLARSITQEILEHSQGRQSDDLTLILARKN